MTAEEFARLPDDGRRWQELVQGQVIAMAPANWRHSRLARVISTRLGLYVHQRALGEVLVEHGFLLARQPDTVRAPDVAFVQSLRLPVDESVIVWFEGPPDLAIEVVSPNDTLTEVQQKVSQYLTAGCRLVWVVEPGSRTVTVYRPDGTARLLRLADMLSGEEVVPGFELALAELFG